MLEGGVGAWEGEGLPLNGGRQTISLERQVRILAGALIVVGSGLSLLNVWFLTLPAFIGAGLMFSGITNSCGMGMMMARMPWNQRRAGPALASCSLEGNRQGSSAA